MFISVYVPVFGLQKIWLGHLVIILLLIEGEMIKTKKFKCNVQTMPHSLGLLTNKGTTIDITSLVTTMQLHERISLLACGR